MSKTLRTAALVVGAVALAATGIGAAASAGLIGAGIGATATVAGVSAATLATVGTLGGLAATGLSLLAAKKPSANVTGSPTQFTADPQGYIPYVIGRIGGAGRVVFAQRASP